MSTKPKPAFELETVTLSLAEILPTKRISPADKAAPRYQTIAASVREVGIVEPLVVYQNADGTFLLLDGHVRREVLLEIGRESTACLVSTDDEAYTYNQKVNRMNPIQEHRMILKAVDAGVSEERIAATLHVQVATIRRTRTLLNGVCAEAIEILKEKAISTAAINVMKRVKPMRQIEMAELMVAARVFTGGYAKALLAATPRAKLVETEAKKRSASANADDLAKMEHEMEALEREMAVLDDSYGRNVVNLTLVRGYVKALLDNGKVVGYLAKKHGELLAQLQKVVEATALET